MLRAARPLWRNAIVIVLVIAIPRDVAAHEKWFYDAKPHQTDWRVVAQMPHLAGLIVALALTGVVAALWRLRGRRDIIPGPTALGATPAGRRRFYAVVPFILGLHVAIPLIVLGIQGQLFSPNNVLSKSLLLWLGVLEIGIGLSFLYGGFTRVAAVVLLALWLVGIGVVGLEPMLENLHYVGFAAFFFLAGRGPYAIDRLLFPAFEPAPRLAEHSMTCLRAFTGAALVVVAFTEKLANPSLALGFLKRYPLNFTPWLGIPMSDETFVVCAGTTELLIGLCLVFGLFPRLIIITAWLFINMTLTIFNWVELVGHLPLYGVMAVLLIWTPDPDDQRLWTSGLLDERADSDASGSVR